jgi:hypothetical protein
MSQEILCDACNARGWIKPPGEDWPVFCNVCSGITGFTVRQIAKCVKMAPKTILKILECRSIRPSTGLRLLERLS